MAYQFIIEKTNYCNFSLYALGEAHERFNFWVRFLNKHCLGRFAITSAPLLNVNALQALWLSAETSVDRDSGEASFTFRVSPTSLYRVIEADLNRILGFPTENLAADPTSEDLEGFFETIGYYKEPMVMSNLVKKFLHMEWDYYFEVVGRVFTTKISGYHGITSISQIIGFALANNLPVNFGRLILK